MIFDPVGICRIMNDEGVRYVVLGGFAAIVHGSSLPTEDIDLLPSRDDKNLECLARALNRLNAPNDLVRLSGGTVTDLKRM